MHLDSLGGQVSYCRLRGSHVQSLSSRAFAVESLSAIPAMTTGRGLVFSGVGAGVHPIAVVGGSIKQALEAMRNSDVEIYVDAAHGLDDAAFTIFARVVPDFKEMPPLRIYDADKSIIKNVGGFFTDTVASVASAFSGIGGLLPDTSVGTFTDWSKGIEARDNFKEGRNFFGGSAKSTGRAGVVISIYDAPGSVRTGRKSMRMADLSVLLARRFT